MSHHMGLGGLERKECGYCLVIAVILFFPLLRSALLSCNSGCQVKERRLWDGVSSSPGLLNWLCYCRPVQGEGGERIRASVYIRHRAFRCDPPPWGRAFTAALSREGDLASIPLPALLPADTGPAPPSPLPTHLIHFCPLWGHFL